MDKCDLIKNSRGFSLVELAVVLSVAAIMAAVSIPILSSAMQGMKLGSDAKSVATTLTYARVSAASRLTRYRMSIDPTNNQWSLLRWNRTSSTYEIEQATNTLSDGISNSGIRFKALSTNGPTGFPSATSTTITFDSRGIPMEGAGIVYLAGRDADFAVAISPSGKIELWRYQNSQWNLK